MNQFFVGPSGILGDTITIVDDDAKHINNVLRLRVGEEILAVCTQDKMTYTCEIESLDKNAVVCKIVDVQKESTELPVEITLYQGLPKGDKFEFIIQKAVEMGVKEIVPVQMKRSIVKLDPKKAESKRNRWQAISKSAAEQSKRRIIPEVLAVQTFDTAIKNANQEFDAVLVPYECAEGIEGTRKILADLVATKTDATKIAIFIGPEGGFADSEIEKVKETKANIITLGRRILRTETAPIAILAWLTYLFEE